MSTLVELIPLITKDDRPRTATVIHFLDGHGLNTDKNLCVFHDHLTESLHEKHSCNCANMCPRPPMMMKPSTNAASRAYVVPSTFRGERTDCGIRAHSSSTHRRHTRTNQQRAANFVVCFPMHGRARMRTCRQRLQLCGSLNDVQSVNIFPNLDNVGDQSHFQLNHLWMLVHPRSRFWPSPFCLVDVHQQGIHVNAQHMEMSLASGTSCPSRTLDTLSAWIHMAISRILASTISVSSSSRSSEYETSTEIGRKAVFANDVAVDARMEHSSSPCTSNRYPISPRILDQPLASTATK